MSGSACCHPTCLLVLTAEHMTVVSGMTVCRQEALRQPDCSAGPPGSGQGAEFVHRCSCVRQHAGSQGRKGGQQLGADIAGNPLAPAVINGHHEAVAEAGCCCHICCCKCMHPASQIDWGQNCRHHAHEAQRLKGAAKPAAGCGSPAIQPAGSGLLWHSLRRCCRRSATAAPRTLAGGCDDLCGHHCIQSHSLLGCTAWHMSCTLCRSAKRWLHLVVVACVRTL